MIWVLAIFYAIILLSKEVRSAPTDGTYDILFLGNSYTSNNNLASRVKHLFDSAGISATVTALTRGGWKLYQHADSAETAGSEWNLALTTKTYDFVVLQDQSQVPSFYGVNSPEYTASQQGAIRLDSMIKDAGAKTIFFLTWGYLGGDSRNTWLSPDYPSMQTNLENGYGLYADSVTSDQRKPYLFPVGLAYRAIYNEILEGGGTPTAQGSDFFNLYSSDGSHPSTQGTYLASCVMFSTMAGESCVGLSDNFGLDSVTRSNLQRIGDSVVFDGSLGYTYPWQETIELVDTDPPTSSTTNRPTSSPTNPPSQKLTPSPSSKPTTRQPSFSPTNPPTLKPSISPTNKPTTRQPSFSPTSHPTQKPATENPTELPTVNSTLEAESTLGPTRSPIGSPTSSPTVALTNSTAPGPTVPPSMLQSISPTISVTDIPTSSLAISLTETPTNSPQGLVTESPSNSPSSSLQPTAPPSQTPSISKTLAPTVISVSPSNIPSEEIEQSSQIPTINVQNISLPTQVPSLLPSTTKAPSDETSSLPSEGASPSSAPSENSAKPSLIPSNIPSESLTPSHHSSPYPSKTGSAVPSASEFPSNLPSSIPSSGSTPKPQNIFSPKAPSSEPSLLPSVSMVPSTVPSDIPSDSTMPSLVPSQIQLSPLSDAPSKSRQPSRRPSLRPTSKESPRPSVSFSPSLQPSQLPTVFYDEGIPMVEPTTETPSASAKPSLIETRVELGIFALIAETGLSQSNHNLLVDTLSAYLTQELKSSFPSLLRLELVAVGGFSELDFITSATFSGAGHPPLDELISVQSGALLNETKLLEFAPQSVDAIMSEMAVDMEGPASQGSGVYA